MSRSTNKLKNDFKDKEYAHAYLNEFLNTNIATQIKVLREQRGLTQEQLASMSDMKQSRISLLENVFYDKWSISTLKKLAEAFDVSLKVSFEKISDRITDMQNLDRVSLERLSREDDLSSAKEPSVDNRASESHMRLVVNNSIIAEDIANPDMIDIADTRDQTGIGQVIPDAQSDKELQEMVV